jgi:coproporphyrinogen III oxidase-like Fe-S oxidoreductase
LLERALTPYMRHLVGRYMHFGPAGEGLLPTPDANKNYLLYIHIPFCEALCPFCSFHRVLLKQPKADFYFDALRREIRWYHDKGFRFADVYVGGGTPTVVQRQLLETLQLVRSLFPIQKISVETNPNHLGAASVRALKRAGVDRLSVGVQSFDDRLLNEMGRLQRYGSGQEIVARLKDIYGIFNSLNVDMIFNLPHQTRASLERDIGILTEEPIADQVSFYPLMSAATTTKAMRKDMGRVTLHRERRYYEKILAGVTPTYQPSTAWCFARKRGLVDEYIVDHEEYIGVGSGAFSYLSGTFYSSSFSIDRYIENIVSGRSAIVMGRKLSDWEQLRYEFLIRLFGLDLDWERMRRSHSASLLAPLWKERLFLTLIGAIRRDGGCYRLTSKGMYLWVVMMREFLSGVNNFRDEMRSHIRTERLLSRVLRSAGRSKPAEHGSFAEAEGP